MRSFLGRASASPPCCAPGDDDGNVVGLGGATQVGAPFTFPIVGISCAIGICMAISESRYAYLDSSGGWVQQTLQPAGDLATISCVSTTFCVATDTDGGYLIYSGGSNWTPDQSMGEQPGNAPTSVSCVSGQFCVAVDDAGNAFTYDGTTWTSDGHIDAGGGPFGGVSCTSATFCAAVNGAAVYTYDGTTWSPPNFVDSGGTLETVSCASSTFCMATDSLGVDSGAVIDSRSFTFDGSTWSGPQLIESVAPKPPYYTGVSVQTLQCPYSTTCFAGDSAGNGFSWGTVAGLGVSTTSVPNATRGVPYGPVALTATVDPSTSPYVTTIKWHKVSLPKGLELSGTGVLSGTPSTKLAGGSSSITVSAIEKVTNLNGTKKVKTEEDRPGHDSLDHRLSYLRSCDPSRFGTGRS